MNIFNSKKIVDERQEYQYHKNSTKAMNFLIIAIGLNISIKILILQLNFKYWFAEWCILLAGCTFKLILDIKDGNLYTKDTINNKRNLAIYIGSSVVTGILVGIGVYILNKNYIMPAIISGITFTIIVFALMMALDYGYKKLTFVRMKKLEQDIENTDDEDK